MDVEDQRQPKLTGELKRSPADRERRAEAIAERLDAAMTALGVIFLLVVLGSTIAGDQAPWSSIFEALAWLIWGAFVVEFVARAIVAPSTGAFLRKNWWQAIFLLVPFLRFIRLFRALRLARAGRVLSSALRTGRTAAAKLRSRMAWVLSLTVIVVLAASEILFEFGQFTSFGDALHAAALAAITGEPLGADNAVARVVEIFLGLYSVVVFASLAGILGAFFLENSGDTDPSKARVAAARGPLEKGDRDVATSNRRR